MDSGVMTGNRLLLLVWVSLALFLTSGRGALADTYRFGVTPWQKGQTEDDINHLYRPMLRYLSEKTGDDFTIGSVADLAERRFGFVKKESSSSFKYPATLLREEGIDDNTYFSRHYFPGSHPRVTDTVAAGMDDYLTKPLKQERLVAALSRFLNPAAVAVHE